MSETLTTLQGGLLGTSGDYWGQLKGDSLRLSRTLSRATDATAVPWSVMSVSNLLKRRRTVVNKTVTFDAVQPIQVDWNAREISIEGTPTLPALNAFDESVSIIVYDPSTSNDQLPVLPYSHPLNSMFIQKAAPTGRSREALYLVYVPNLVPISIRTVSGQILTLGTSYTSSYPYVVFKEDPEILFPDKKIWVLGGVETGCTLFSYLLGVEGASNDKAITAFVRGGEQSPKSYENALNSVAGSFIPSEDVEVDEIFTVSDYAKFISTGSKFIPVHPETEIKRESTFAANYANPRSVKVHYAGSLTSVLINRGFILDFFGKEQPLPTGDINLSRTGNFVELLVNDPRVEAWNDYRQGTPDDKISSLLIEETSIADGQTMLVNVADLLVRRFYQNSLLLVEIYEDQIAPANLEDLLWFMRYHQPVGALQFVLERPLE